MLLVKTAVDLTGMAVALLLGTLALAIAARAVHGFTVPGTFYAGLILALAGAAFVYALALLISTRSDDPLKAGAAAAVAAEVLSVPSFVPGWRRGSVYVHMTGRELFQNGTFPWLALLVIGALTLGLVILAAESLQRRDI